MSEGLKFRHELKHYRTYSDYLTIRQRLNIVARHDRNVNNDGKYKIRSLYFDNDDNKVLREKRVELSAGKSLESVIIMKIHLL